MHSWIARSVGFADLAAAATQADKTVYQCSRDSHIEKVVAVPEEEFAGGGATSATVSFGITGTETKYQSAQDVFTGSGTGLANAKLGTVQGVEALGTDLVCRLISDVNTDTLTAGRVTYHILISSLPPVAQQAG